MSSKDGEEEKASPNGAGKMSEEGEDSTGEVGGNLALRPIFLGNLMPNYTAEHVGEAFEHPERFNMDQQAVFVDRVDIKRGYCFVFLKDAKNQEDKKRIEEFVVAINGIEVPHLSRAVRAEFARGDGRVKRKEDERRKNIAPSETLFVVNFHEETTRREDLEMLFQEYGELVRIDMKRNYAFVQFKTIEQATRAKENTNGGKIDQSVITVEYVARQRSNEQRGGSRGRDSRSGDRRGGGDRFFDDRGGRRYDDRRGGGRAPVDPYYAPRYDDRRSRVYDDDRYGRPPPPRGRDSPPPYRRARSRSRSPRYGRSRSPPPRRYDDDYGRGGGRRRSRSPSPPPPRRGPSPEDRDRDSYRGGGDRDRDRGYRG